MSVKIYFQLNVISRVISIMKCFLWCFEETNLNLEQNDFTSRHNRNIKSMETTFIKKKLN